MNSTRQELAHFPESREYPRSQFSACLLDLDQISSRLYPDMEPAGYFFCWLFGFLFFFLILLRTSNSFSRTDTYVSGPGAFTPLEICPMLSSTPSQEPSLAGLVLDSKTTSSCSSRSGVMSSRIEFR